MSFRLRLMSKDIQSGDRAALAFAELRVVAMEYAAAPFDPRALLALAEQAARFAEAENDALREEGPDT